MNRRPKGRKVLGGTKGDLCLAGREPKYSHEYKREEGIFNGDENGVSVFTRVSEVEIHFRSCFPPKSSGIPNKRGQPRGPIALSFPRSHRNPTQAQKPESCGGASSGSVSRRPSWELF